MRSDMPTPKRVFYQRLPHARAGLGLPKYYVNANRGGIGRDVLWGRPKREKGRPDKTAR